MSRFAALGRAGLAAAAFAGGTALVVGRTLAALPRLDRRELVRSLVHFGTASLPLGAAIAAFVGSILVTQTGIYVRRFGAREILGWAAGYAILREFGPLLVTLVMAGRIGARNAAELAALNLGGQVEGLRGAGVDPFAVLVAPRVVAATVAMALVGVACSAIAVLAGSITAVRLLDVSFHAFYRAFAEYLGPADVVFGLAKDAAFGLAIAFVSTLAGLRARGGARAVGQAAAAAVVWSAAAVALLDFLLAETLGKAI